MTSLQRIGVAVLTMVFVFCALAVLAPEPRDPVRGDNKMFGALTAALAAGAIVMVVS